MPNPMKDQSNYIHGLDGLRAIAVFAVIAYHLSPEWASGGLLGVTVFFVLSGYLITNLLLIEWETNQTINLKRFWIRRAKRLLPAMFTMLLVITAWVTLFEQSFLVKLREDFVAATFYVSNWWYIFQDLSYFESMGTPSLLTHFWSLAVEEQFYIVWPLLIFLALTYKLNKKIILSSILIIAALSAIAMALLYVPGTDPSRVYYGTDTRVFSLLIGAALAFVWPSRKLAKNLPPRIRVAMDTVGITALFLVIFMMCTSNEYDSFLYQGGMVLISLLAAILIAVLVHPSSQLNRWLSFKPLRWIGVRSYGIYLWQYPILILTTPLVDTGETSIIRTILQIILILVISDISYRFVENPIRHGAISRFFHKMRSKELNTVSLTRWISVICGLLIVCISTIGLAAKPSENFITSESQNEKKEEIILEKNETKNSNVTIKPKDETINGNPKNSGEKPPVQDSDHLANRKVTIIGDSVMIDAAPYLKKQFSNVNIDAKVGRQMYHVEDVVNSMKKAGNLGDSIVIGLGSNGAFNSKQLISVITSLDADQNIYLVNTRVPKPWESTVNKELNKVASRFNNITVIDWYSSSTGHNEYFAKDGVHLSKQGAQAYATLISKTLKKK